MEVFWRCAGLFLRCAWLSWALRSARGGTCWEDRNVWGSGTTKPSDVAEKRRSLKPKGQIPGNCRAAVGCLHIAASSPRPGATYNFSGRPPPSPNRLSPTQMATQFSCPTLRIIRAPKGVSISSRVEESLRDGPLDAQFIPVASGRPGSGILLLIETPDAQPPPSREAPQPSQAIRQSQAQRKESPAQRPPHLERKVRQSSRNKDLAN